MFCLVSLTFLSSCKFEEESEENLQEVNARPYVIVIENEPLSNEEIFISNLLEGDEVLIEITGKYTKPKFSEEYTTESTSTWKERFCFSYDDYGNGQIPKAVSCYWQTKRGKCSSLFKDYLGQIKSNITFGDSSINPKLSYFIGSREFPIEQEQSYGQSTLKAKVNITERLVSNSSSFSIKAYPDEEINTIKSGFLGHLSCVGVGKNSFDPHVSTASENIPSTRQYEYFVTVKIRERE